MKRVYILGSGGHAKVLEEIVELNGDQFLGFINDDENFIEQEEKEKLVNGIGGVKDNKPRREIFNKYKKAGFDFPVMIHPSVIYSKRSSFSEGVQLFAGVIVQRGVTINENTIINTGASVDHDCSIGAHVHIAPGVVISGNVEIGEGTHIGTGARIIQSVVIGSNCVIAAGAVVTKNVADGKTVMGVPAKEVN